MPDADAPASAPPRLAALVALALGLLAAVMMVAGHAPWEGPEVASITQDHGLHAGDVLAFGPLVVSVWLARWCLRTGDVTG